MIVGIGMDLVELGRVKRILDSSLGQRFVARILTEGEQVRLSSYKGQRVIEFVAGRFAAKEAVVKALGCGIGSLVAFCDIEILPGKRSEGRPCVKLSAGAMKRLEMGSDMNIHLSITHTETLAGAYAVVEKGNCGE